MHKFPTNSFRCAALQILSLCFIDNLDEVDLLITWPQGNNSPNSLGSPTETSLSHSLIQRSSGEWSSTVRIDTSVWLACVSDAFLTITGGPLIPSKSRMMLGYQSCLLQQQLSRDVRISFV